MLRFADHQADHRNRERYTLLRSSGSPATELNALLVIPFPVSAERGSPVFMRRASKRSSVYTAHACPHAEVIPGNWEGMLLTQPPVSSKEHGEGETAMVSVRDV